MEGNCCVVAVSSPSSIIPLRVVCDLEEMEFDPTSTSEDNIWIACSDGDVARVAQLLQSGVSANVLDENGYSPIHAAVSYGHVEVIELLLAAGANPNLPDLDGDTPLHVCESAEVAQLMMMNGADPTIVNEIGETVFDKAIEDENEEMINFWTEKGFATRGEVAHNMEEEGDDAEEEDCEDVQLE